MHQETIYRQEGGKRTRGDVRTAPPLVSIITPSRNQGKYIRHCLESIYSQSHRNLEHLVLDGMSTDETGTVVKEYGSRFFQEVDSGPAQAINRGLDLAKGDVVCWLNADDAFFGPETLRQVVELFDQHPEIDVVTGNGYYIDDAGKLLQPIIPAHCSHMTREWMNRGDLFLQPATFWRRNSHRLNEKLHYTFDWQLWIDFYRDQLNIVYIPQYFAAYRIQPGSLTQQDRPLRREEIYRIVAKNGDHGLQALWCWIVWKVYIADERMHTEFFRRAIRFANAVLNRITAGRICSP